MTTIASLRGRRLRVIFAFSIKRWIPPAPPRAATGPRAGKLFCLLREEGLYPFEVKTAGGKGFLSAAGWERRIARLCNN